MRWRLNENIVTTESDHAKAAEQQRLNVLLGSLWVKIESPKIKRYSSFCYHDDGTAHIQDPILEGEAEPEV